MAFLSIAWFIESAVILLCGLFIYRGVYLPYGVFIEQLVHLVVCLLRGLFIAWFISHAIYLVVYCCDFYHVVYYRPVCKQGKIVEFTLIFLFIQS